MAKPESVFIYVGTYPDQAGRETIGCEAKKGGTTRKGRTTKRGEGR
jgi:hypothetical protein